MLLLPHARPRWPALLLALLLCGAAPAADSHLTVRFFDVGQGDAALVTTPSGKTVLIDGGPPESASHLTRRLRELVKQPLDVVVLTHPHLDHLGGLSAAIEAVGARRYLEPDFDHPSTAYLSLLELLSRKTLSKLSTGDPSRRHELVSYALEEEVRLWVLWPRRGPDGETVDEFLFGTRSDANSNSIVAKLVHGKASFLFSGDAEADTEQLLAARRLDLSATVLKVAHHGSRHSSTEQFLARVRPRAAVVSCGKGNEYGHPAPETLKRLESAGAAVFRTDADGEVIAQSDGKAVTLSAERRRGEQAFQAERTGAVALGRIEPYLGPAPSPKPEEPRYVASRRSRVFHLAGCPAVASIKESNRIVFTQRSEAARGRSPAGDCRP
ncbi:MAG: MBL fold metallo-hydrolase [Myxococcales bacterium]|nr:MBL fold metallo-hydrolase [Myxococcales bacterium]